MILDIKYVSGYPIQIQKVRMIKIYPHCDKAVIYHDGEPQEVIQLKGIYSIQVTND